MKGVHAQRYLFLRERRGLAAGFQERKQFERSRPVDLERTGRGTSGRRIPKSPGPVGYTRTRCYRSFPLAGACGFPLQDVQAGRLSHREGLKDAALCEAACRSRKGLFDVGKNGDDIK